MNPFDTARRPPLMTPRKRRDEARTAAAAVSGGDDYQMPVNRKRPNPGPVDSTGGPPKLDGNADADEMTVTCPQCGATLAVQMQPQVSVKDSGTAPEEDSMGQPHPLSPTGGGQPGPL